MSTILVRRYRAADRTALGRLHRAARTLPDTAAGGSVCVAVKDGPRGDEQAVGYTVAVPVPGLSGVGDIQGYVTPPMRRQGIGSRLLQALVEERRLAGDRQLSHGVASLEDPAARFLRRRGFFLEHEEWQMVLEPLRPVSEGTVTLQTFGHGDAIGRFRELYDDSFGGTPWYQPYTSDAEVALDLDKPTDLLFLVHRGELAGFSWLRMKRGQTAVIEPLGIAGRFQGQGLGQELLSATLAVAFRRGASRARLGVWRTNRAARRLYSGAGFRRAGRLHYLALDLLS